MAIQLGTKVPEVDLVGLFQAGDGEIHQIIGAIGNGKTYLSTKMAIDDLKNGEVVYTTWKIDYTGFDQRKDPFIALRNLLFFQSRYYAFPVENWHYIDPIEYFDENFIDKFEKITDAKVYLDEGHIPFDSYEAAKMSIKKRVAVLHTRHMNRTIIIISQRARNVHTQLRANVNRFYKVEKKLTLFGKILFRRTETQELDNNDMPDFENSSSVKWYWSEKRIFNAYNSKYLRLDRLSSQQVYFDAYELNFIERIYALYLALGGRPLERRPVVKVGKLITKKHVDIPTNGWDKLKEKHMKNTR